MRKSEASGYFALGAPSANRLAGEVFKACGLGELVRHLRQLAGRGTLRIVCFLTGEAIEFEFGRRY